MGEEIRERRKRHNLSQEQLGDQTELHTNTIGRLERGIYNPSVKVLVDIAVKLHTNLADLFAGAAQRQ